MSESYYCIKCKWSSLDTLKHEYYCNCEKCIPIDLVTGEPIKKLCSIMRDKGDCGFIGKYWEAK